MRNRHLTGPAAFWAVALALMLVLIASGVPSPLYRVYQAEFGFSSGVLTLVFAVYVFGLVTSLLVVGALSDHVGRRPVLVAGLLLEAASMGLFLSADGVGWLLAARVVQGLATGAMTGAFGAALLDLQRPERPLGPLVNSVTPGLGLSLGAVGAGVLVQYVASPTDWVFGLLIGVFVLAALGVVLLVPESSPRRPGAIASLRPTVHVPAADRGRFLAVLPCLLATWALGGLYASLGPSLVADVFGIDDHLVGSLLILALNGTGVVASLTLRGVAPVRAMVSGAVVFTAGVSGTVLALETGATALFFSAAVVSGWGFGSAFLGALSTVAGQVAPEQRAALLSAVFTAAYLGFSLPAVAAGIAVGRWGLTATAEVYAAGVIALTLAALAGTWRQQRRPQRQPAEPASAVDPAMRLRADTAA